MEAAAMPVDHGTDSTAEQQSPILRLPGEVRNTIYRLCLKIRAEAEGIFYGENTFRITYMDKSESKCVTAWAKSLKKETHATAIPKVIIKFELRQDVEQAITDYLEMNPSSGQHVRHTKMILIRDLLRMLVSDMAEIVAASNIPSDRVALEKPKGTGLRAMFANKVCDVFPDIAAIYESARDSGSGKGLWMAIWHFISHHAPTVGAMWKCIKLVYHFWKHVPSEKQ
ncbi:hypothetical protein LTR37_017093 [Vermiconidia calcicola]|uniref:Uncharacterized protein n=1 Tax=Vermiconidia calcicola TaxID=1690605 RepID=A0ACC3ML01_9PEZI|nr:hypothetical protein LTR37_017093 [Vermiconidia calcicola]